MVYRIYVEKKKEYATEAKALLSDLRDVLGIKGLSDLRIINRYDVEDVAEELFARAVGAVFSEPQVDIVSSEPDTGDGRVFAVEYLPGQFDQRADSAAQCIQLISMGARPAVRSAKLYVLYGVLPESDFQAVKKYVINPVEAREASLALPETLMTPYPVPPDVPVFEGFRRLEGPALGEFIKKNGLAMDADDLAFCRDYFRDKGRDPTVTEIKMIDTYWSDHCRHTTFLTELTPEPPRDGRVADAYRRYLSTRELAGDRKPVTLMDIATVGVKYLKKSGKLPRLDESEEINACTVKIDVTEDGKDKPWLLLFKNETHNHPTEIEPFGGAATCIGGAIRDPLSGRAYVYGAMRVTGASDPTVPVSETLPGKLPQRKLVTTAAAGYSSYGNQIGLATGIVDEIYHPGYAAKHMEIGAVIAAAPSENVRRERPAPGDSVILLGGDTGRDGIGGATGSSKAHDAHSVETCGAEVQKGNAPEERKLQRLFRNGEATRLIKRCNDFGAGGVSVAIGELADGLDIDLDAVPKKYDGLDGTELAISESQERMAVVVSASDAEKFIALANAENLKATPVARVTDTGRLVMRWRGKTVVDIGRGFLNSNGAKKRMDVSAAEPAIKEKDLPDGFRRGMLSVAGDLPVCSRRGLGERFDGTIGAGSVLMPFGGKYQLTPAQAMVQKIPLEKGETDCCSFMAYGYDPVISEESPYHGAYLAVTESLSKLVASGAKAEGAYLTFQEYFEKPGRDARRWGKPFSALLGALEAQLDFETGAIGGKDSMSGSFEDLDVPPTLVSFAVTTGKTSDAVSPEFRAAGHPVILVKPSLRDGIIPEAASQREVFRIVSEILASGRGVSCSTPVSGGIAASVMKSCFGNGLGFDFSPDLSVRDLFGRIYGAFLIEVTEAREGERIVGYTTDEKRLSLGGETVSVSELLGAYEGKLESVYPVKAEAAGEAVTLGVKTGRKSAPAVKCASPRFLIPVFPGTNCEYDSARAVASAGGVPEIFVVRNLTPEDVRRSAEDFAGKIANSQAIFIPGGFSGGDEPDGSGKFITSFFRSGVIRDAVTDLLDGRGGLMCGICNGFQALIKLGLVPYGRITDADGSSPTLTYNVIGRHQSRIVRTRVASDLSPWLSLVNVGDVISVPISHGEGRFVADGKLLKQLAENGQIATQYVDLDGMASMDVAFNPNGSAMAVEGITSPDGRVFGKMGHSERVGRGLYVNVPGNYDLRMFESAVKFFRGN
ncbi:MAG: phosphoribosylformylglycinamidine synthase [Clostridia bacterium]|nr:phosphoribosylformylglycinamidine synthase [Clostridia bacterium]